MSVRVYSGVSEALTLQTAVDTLRSQAGYGIVENLTEIDFPPPKRESIAVTRWPKGRIFCQAFELRWEQVDGVYRAIFVGEEGQEPPTGLTEEILEVHSFEDVQYCCWDENNPRLGRTLDYRCVPAKGNVKLVVREYRDKHGQLIFWRYIEMRREGKQ